LGKVVNRCFLRVIRNLARSEYYFRQAHLDGAQPLVQSMNNRSTLVIFLTTIGNGALTKAGTSGVHG